MVTYIRKCSAVVVVVIVIESLKEYRNAIQNAHIHQKYEMTEKNGNLEQMLACNFLCNLVRWRMIIFFSIRSSRMMKSLFSHWYVDGQPVQDSNIGEWLWWQQFVLVKERTLLAIWNVEEEERTNKPKEKVLEKETFWEHVAIGTCLWMIHQIFEFFNNAWFGYKNENKRCREKSHLSRLDWEMLNSN